MKDSAITLNVPSELITTTYNHIPSISSISYYHLLPSTKKDWVTSIVDSEGEKVVVDSLKIKFSPARKGQEYLEFMQRAALLCDIETTTKEGEWRFTSEGIVIPEPELISDFSITTHLLDNKKRLLVMIDKVGSTGSTPDKTHYFNIEFNYIATCKDSNGKVTPYLSQDPSIELGRPVGG